MAALPAQPPKEASPAKQSASTMNEPLTDGVDSLLLARDQDLRLYCHLHAPPVERRHHGGLSWDYLPVSFSADETSIVKDFQKHVMPLVRPSWTEKLLWHRVFEDGVTNKLLGFFREDPGASSSADDSTAVLVRVNGEGRELVVDGETEILVILTLHKSGLCPPLYLVAENALCYGYIPGRALAGNEMQAKPFLHYVHVCAWADVCVYKSTLYTHITHKVVVNRALVSRQQLLMQACSYSLWEGIVQ